MIRLEREWGRRNARRRSAASECGGASPDGVFDVDTFSTECALADRRYRQAIEWFYAGRVSILWSRGYGRDVGGKIVPIPLGELW